MPLGVSMRFPRGIPNSNTLRSLKNEFLLPGREVEEPPEPFRVVILLKVWDSRNS